MEIKQPTKTVLATLVLVVSSFGVQASVEKDIDNASMYNSLQLIESILEKSSVAKRVKQSKSQQAITLLEQARDHYQRAQSLIRQDRLKEAISERDMALQLAMKAARLANQELGDSDKHELEDYEKRRSSVQVLLAAHRRIAVEKNNLNLDKNLNRVLTPFLQESENFAKRREYQKAIFSLNKAYAMVTSSIENQRAGETLVRSLDFEDKEDEFNYELGRYENYLTLVKMLIDERKVLKLDSTSKPIWNKAHQQSEQAQSYAVKGDYDRAIAEIDQASKNLINLIRYAGVYIPGG